MARHILTDEQVEIAHELGIYVGLAGGPWVSGHRDLDPILSVQRQRADAAVAEKAAAERQAYLDAGRVEWRKYNGEWMIAGKNIAEGETVTVTRLDGSTSDEVVGRIRGVRDGLTVAEVATRTI